MLAAASFLLVEIFNRCASYTMSRHQGDLRLRIEAGPSESEQTAEVSKMIIARSRRYDETAYYLYQPSHIV